MSPSTPSLERSTARTPASPSTSAPRPLRRRTLRAAAVWAVPTAVLASAAPAVAASASACSSAEDGTSLTGYARSWTTVSGELKTDENQTGWTSADEFRSWDNNASSTEPAVIEATTEFSGLAGATYAVSLDAVVGAGTSPNGVQDQAVQIDVIVGGIAHKLVWVLATTVLGREREGHVNQCTWDQSPVTYTLEGLTLEQSSTIVVRYRFTLDPTADVNHDIWVQNLEVVQTACS